MRRRFSRDRALCSLHPRGSRSRFRLSLMRCGFAYNTLSRHQPESNYRQQIQQSVTPIALALGHGILTVCPSGAALAIPLGPTNPELITMALETLVFRRAGFSPALWLLVPAFSLPYAPAWVTPLPSSQNGTLSYRVHSSEGVHTRNFGTTLNPDHLRRKDPR